MPEEKAGEGGVEAAGRGGGEAGSRAKLLGIHRQISGGHPTFSANGTLLVSAFEHYRVPPDLLRSPCSTESSVALTVL